MKSAAIELEKNRLTKRGTEAVNTQNMNAR